MIGLICLISALLLGAGITRRLGFKYLAFEAPALGVALGLLLWTWLFFAASLAMPQTYSLGLTCLTGAAVGLYMLHKGPKWHWEGLQGGPGASTAWLLFSVASTTLIGYLMWTHDLLPNAGALYSANATWGDFGMHSSLISFFAASPHLTLEFPVAAGAHLTYPFLADLLSSAFVRGGWSLHLATFVPSLLLTTTFLQLMLAFGVRLFGRIGGAVAALSLFLFAGSAAGMFVAYQDFTTNSQSLLAFLSHLPKDYSILATPNIQISNVIADILLPQRAFQLGFAVFAAALILIVHLQKRPNLKLSLFLGGIIGLLPLVHAHTFIVLMTIIGTFWLWDWLKTHVPTNQWLGVMLMALAIATPQIIWQMVANGGGSGGHLAPGWVIEPGQSLAWFWVQNYGASGLLIIITSLVLLFSKRLQPYARWYLPFVGVFVLANIYSVQTYAYDNLKLILYVFLLTYLLVCYGAVWIIKQFKMLIIPLALLAVLISGSGILATTREFQHLDQFASPDDIDLAQWSKTMTPPGTVFLTTDMPNQPLATLSGRLIVAGYRGYLEAFKIDYQPRLDTIQAGLEGNLTLANPYHAEYVAVAAYESPEWTVDRPALASHYTLVYSNSTWQVYRLPATPTSQ